MPQYVKELSLTPYIKPFVAGATKEFTELQHKLADDYDTVATQYDALQEAADNMSSLPFKGDLAEKQRVFNKVSDAIKEAAKAGDYENRARLVRRSISEFKKDYAPIQKQITDWEAFKKDVEESVKSKRKGQDYANKILNAAKKQYESQKGLQRTSNGEYKGISQYLNQYADEVDINEEVLKAITPKLAHANSTASKIEKKDGNYYVTTEHGVEQVDSATLQEVVKRMWANNKNLQAYSRDNALLDYYINPSDASAVKQDKINSIVQMPELSKELLQKELDKLKQTENKTGKKYPNILATAEANLKKLGYVKPESKQKVLDTYLNSPDKDVYIKHRMEEDLYNAMQLGEVYKYQKIKDDFSLEETSAYRKKQELQAEQDFANTGSFITGSGATFTEEQALNNDRQQKAIKLNSAAIEFIRTENKNFNDEFKTNLDFIQLKKLANEIQKNPNQIEQIKTKYGLANADNDVLLAKLDNINASFNNLRESGKTLTQLDKINKEINGFITTPKIKQQAEAVFTILSKNGSVETEKFLADNNIKDYNDLITFIRTKESSKHLGEQAKAFDSLPRSIKSELLNSNKKLYDEIQKSIKDNKKVLEDHVIDEYVVSNPDVKSSTNQLEKKIELGISKNLDGQTIYGTDIPLDSYLGQKFEGKAYKLLSTAVVLKGQGGNKKIRATLEVDGQTKPIHVFLNLGQNKELVDTHVISSYADDSQPKTVKSATEQAYFDEKISNPEDLDLLNTLDIKEITLSAVNRDYHVQKLDNNYYKIYYINGANEKVPVDKAVKDLNTVRAVIGKKEIVDVYKTLKN